MTAFVRSSGISNVELKDDEVQQIVDTLIYDGKVEKVKDAAISIPVHHQTPSPFHTYPEPNDSLPIPGPTKLSI